MFFDVGLCVNMLYFVYKVYYIYYKICIYYLILPLSLYTHYIYTLPILHNIILSFTHCHILYTHHTYSTLCHRDKALQSFHTLKIREINKIIRELWQLIYKGQDIDSIEIESGVEDGTTTTAAAARNSRSYNYRVVMRKGNVGVFV